MEYFKYLGSIITNNAKYTREIKSRIAMAKAAFNSKKALVKSTLDLKFRKNLVSFYIWSIAFIGVESSESRSEIPGNFGMWCWRRMQKPSWADHVKNKKVLQTVKEERNNLHIIQRKKAK